MARQLVVVLMVALALGCRAAPQEAPPGPEAGAQAALAALVTAATGGDRSGFDRLISHRDPAFEGPAAVLYENLDTLPLAAVTMTAIGPDAAVSAPRQAIVGATARAHPVAVRWRLVGEERLAEHRVWMTFVEEEGTTRLAGLVDAPSAAGLVAAPLWWSEPAGARTAGPVTVLGARGVDLDRWGRRGQRALAAVADHVGDARVNDGPVVIEVPSTRQAFERVLGVAPRSYSGIAAVAWAEGIDPAAAAVRIVVNPTAVAQTSEEGLRVLLAHEATHVATQSVDSPAPTWLVEGFADWVAYEAHPATRDEAARGLLAEVAASGPPPTLPSDAAFDPGSERLELAYAQAWLVCRYLSEEHGPEALNRFYAAVDRGRPVEVALRAELDTDPTAFTDGWQRYLSRLARDR